jgi:hypothetical protein
LFGNL